MDVAPGRSLWLVAARVGSWAVATILVLLLVPRLPNTGTLELDAFLGFILGLLPMLAISWTMARSGVRSLLLAGLILGGLVVSGLLSWAGSFTLAVPFKVVFATGAGILLGRQVAEAWWLAAIAVIAIVADTWSVFAGPTKVVVERAPGALDYLLVHFPIVGAQGPGMGLGISDFIFLSLFTVGALGAGLRSSASFVAMGASLPVTVAVALLWKPALPALPFLALAFLAVNAGAFISLIGSGRRVPR
jgi:hypothetical protein